MRLFLKYFSFNKIKKIILNIKVPINNNFKKIFIVIKNNIINKIN